MLNSVCLLRFRLFAGLAVCLGLISAPLPAGALPDRPGTAGRPLHVLVLNSFHQDIPWQRSFGHGLLDGLKGSGRAVQLYEEYLDAGRLPDGPPDELLQRYLEAKYRKIELDVLMTESAPAAAFVDRHPGLFPRARRIYLQPSTTPSAAVANSANATIINTVDDYRAAIQEMQRMVAPQRLYVIADASTPARQRRLTNFREALEGLRPAFETEYLVDRTMEDLTAQVASLPAGSAIFYLLIFRDGAGRQFVPYHAVELLSARANAPIFSNWESLLGSGIVGGHLISGELLGKIAANTALGHAAPGDGPIAYGFYYDARQLRRWKIDMGRLPPGATVRFDEPSVLERYRREIAAVFVALALLAVLSASMFVLNIRRKRAEEEARESARQYRNILDQLQDIFYRTDSEGRIVMISPAVQNICGYTPDELIGRKLADYYADPARRAEFLEALERAGGEISGFEGVMRHKDGGEVLVSTNAHYHRADDGRILGVEGVARDIRERRALEEQLRQAQKMEAVGQLTGGVAHDFNNLLAVVSGNAELLSDTLGDDKLLAAIQRAAERGAELTQRLLSFSRQQTLRPRPIDLSELISGLSSLFRTTLGVSVELVTEIAADTGRVVADSAQLENALLNLAINARDAMPDGGRLEIGCENVRLDEETTHLGEPLAAGDYVLIRVRDTGVGMSEDVLQRALEPFYTTKDVGEGSGLGLSMVYGFARQSGGDVAIESAPGRGTLVKLYLPRVEAEDTATLPDASGLPGPGNGQRVLVLEDEPDVRDFAVTVLEALGYRVVDAADAEQANRRLEAAGGVDLVLSDLVLPGGVSGPQFVAEARSRNPALRAVFMTGYAPEEVVRRGLLGADETMLRKPFRRGELAQAVYNSLL